MPASTRSFASASTSASICLIRSAGSRQLSRYVIARCDREQAILDVVLINNVLDVWVVTRLECIAQFQLIIADDVEPFVA